MHFVYSGVRISDMMVPKESMIPMKEKDTPEKDIQEEAAPQPHVDVERVYGRNWQPDPPAPAAKHSRFRKYFFYVLIGGVVISALISVVAILIGEINDYISRSLLTTLSMVIHAMIALAFMSATGTQRTTGQELVINTLFGVTIASFFTTTLGIWKVISGDTMADFYQLYLYALLAALLVRMLLGVNTIDKLTNGLMRTAIGTTVFLWLYLIPSVFDDGYPKTWPEVYYRGIAAVGVVLGTVLILVTIFHRLYLVKHPEARAAASSAPRAGGIPVWLIVILCVIAAPIVLGWLGTIVGLLGYFVIR